MSCVILLMRLGCFPSLLLKINDIRQGSSLFFFSYSPICLTNLQNWELDQPVKKGRIMRPFLLY